MRIKNTKRNKIYLIIGRVTTVLLIYGMSILASVKVLEFIVNNCITTL